MVPNIFFIQLVVLEISPSFSPKLGRGGSQKDPKRRTRGGYNDGNISRSITCGRMIYGRYVKGLKKDHLQLFILYYLKHSPSYEDRGGVLKWGKF